MKFLTVFDGADLPLSDTQIVFTQVRLDSGSTTELNIVNPGDSVGNLQLQLFGAGSSTVNKTMSLQAKGVARLDVAEFFETTETPPDAHVIVTSDVEIAGFELVRAPDGDLVGLNARAADEQLNRLYFPQVAVLGGFETSLGVVNNAGQAVILTITVFKPDGSAYGTEDVQNNPVTRPLNPGDTLVERVDSMFGFIGEDLREGWLRVDSSSPAVTGFLTYALPEQGGAATVTPNRFGQTEAIISHIATVPGFFTGLAILNPGQLAANVRILAIQRTGEILGTAATTLQPRERISQLITELVGENAAGQGNGLIFIRSNLPVYLTSLFGTDNLKVLSNIPPQGAPEGYAPDEGLVTLNVTPAIALVQPNNSRSFEVQGGTQEVTWAVNGEDGGNATVGTVSADGSYTAPAEVPLPRTVTVSASAAFESAGASVDILDKSALLTSESIVQSIVYLGSLQRIYTAELTLLGTLGNSAAPASARPAQGNADSEVFVHPAPGAPKESVAKFDGEFISKAISFVASDGREFLLLAARDGGEIIRLDPDSGQSVAVITGLNQPVAIVCDENSQTVLVAEQDKVSLWAKQQFEADLFVFARTSPPHPQPKEVTLFTTGADGIAINRCTGDVYVSNRESGVIRQYVAATGELLDPFSGFNQPGQLLTLHRNGVSCPGSFQLLLAETGLDRLTLLTPAQGVVSPWLNASQPTDVSFLPGGTPFAATSGILFTELADGQQPQQQPFSQGSIITTPGMFEDPVNIEGEGIISPLGFCVFADEAFRSCAQEAVGTSADVTTEEAQDITELNCVFETLQQSNPELEQARSLDGLQCFSNLIKLEAEGHLLGRCQELVSLPQLEILNLGNNRFNSLRIADCVPELGNLRELDLSRQRITTPFGDIAAIIDLDFLIGLDKLEKLNLSDNAITDIGPLLELPNLMEVDLTDNPLIGQCSRIQSLIDAGVTVLHDEDCP